MTDASSMAVYARVAALIVHAEQWLDLALKTAGGSLIAIGAAIVIVRLARHIVRGDTSRLTTERLLLARFLTLALEFQLAADVLDTAMAPGWQEIGQLAAIAVIRTALNFSLTREIANER
jgi:uncharacterized membrane protein